MTILETKDLRKHYGSGETEVRALDGVGLTVEKGEFVAVVGTSGSGKSTLLHMLGGLDRPTSGSVTVDGKDIFSLKDEALTIFRRRKIGFVFQNYNLVPVLSVYENIVLPIQLDGRKPDSGYVDQIMKPWAWRRGSGTSPITSPADSSSGWPSPGPWRPSPPSSWPTSRRATWIPGPARTSWPSLKSQGRSSPRPSS